MTINQKPTGTASSIPAGLAAGAMVSVLLTMAGAMVTAKLMESQLIPWSGCGYGVLVILLTAAWAGSMVSAKKIKRLRALMCLTSGGIYFALLLMATALFFGGRYSGVGETALLILCGSMLALFSGLPGKTGRKQGKTIRRNR